MFLERILFTLLFTTTVFCLELEEFMDENGVLSLKELFEIECSTNSSVCRPIDYKNCASEDVSFLDNIAGIRVNMKSPQRKTAPKVIYLAKDSKESNQEVNKTIFYEVDGTLYLTLDTDVLSWMERIQSVLFHIGLDGNVREAKVNRLFSGKNLIIGMIAGKENMKLSNFLKSIRHLKYNEEEKFFFLGDTIWDRLSLPRYANNFVSNELKTIETIYWALQVKGLAHLTPADILLSDIHFHKAFNDTEGRFNLDLDYWTKFWMRNFAFDEEKSQTSLDRLKKEYLNSVWQPILNVGSNTVMVTSEHTPPVDVDLGALADPTNDKFATKFEKFKFVKDDSNRKMKSVKLNEIKYHEIGPRRYHYKTCIPECTRANEYFPHLTHCNKFYFCDKNLEPLLKRCLYNEIFVSDQLGGRCVTDESVFGPACSARLYDCP